MESEQPGTNGVARTDPTVEYVDLISDSGSEVSAASGDWSLSDVAVQKTMDQLDAELEEQGLIERLQESDGDESEEEEWETESLYADALEGMANGAPMEACKDGGQPTCGCRPLLMIDRESGTADDACTLEEACAYRQQLRTLGPEQFVKATVEARRITAKKLCTAFDIRLPPFLEGAPDVAYFPLLGLGITRELSKRIKLPQYNTIEDAVTLLKKSKNIIVLTGAGISTSLGIPDFRSKDTGLYSKLEHLGLSDPQEVFDISLFREDPRIFYSIAKDILPTTNRYSPTHAFIRLLQEKDKLLTNYSQNIDDIESKAGISPDKLIQCHGSFATASCLTCRHKVKCDEIFTELREGKLAYCSRCKEGSTEGSLKRKRSAKDGSSGNARKRRRDADSESDEEEDGEDYATVMKPDITFFGEALPKSFDERLERHDRDLVDLVIVIGTSLKVAPVSNVVGFLPPNVPQIYISRTPVSHVDFDIELLGDCDVVVAELCRRAGWDLRHDMIPENQQVDIELRDGYQSRYVVSVRSA